MRNYSPKELSLISAVTVGCFLLVTLSLVKFYSPDLIDMWMVFLSPVITSFLTFFTFQYIVKRFIHERIKLIYKNIYEFKSVKGQTGNTIDLEQDVISQVDEEVKNWMDTKRSEIKSLKKAEEYRKQFLSNVSHELKTPIFSVLGYLETLLDGGMDDESIRINYLERAVKNTERLAEILKDLDEISSLESEMITLDLEFINLRDLVVEVIDSLQLLAYNFNISLVIDPGVDKGVMVEADRHRIKQVLTNLFTNSIKYGKKGGQTKVSWFDMDENILIEVTDNGIGIDKQHISRLFERFYRVDKNRSRERGGTGLGLSIVKHIIEAHKQTITVRSTEGVGSTFGFTLKKG